jgi:hypothetical protein
VEIVFIGFVRLLLFLLIVFAAVISQSTTPYFSYSLAVETIFFSKNTEGGLFRIFKKAKGF